MNQMLCDHIDQLDLALDQLAMKDRNFDRFAIMLIDNVVELTLHQHARDRQIFSDVWSPSADTKFSEKSLQAALGQKFDAKVAFALKTGLLTQEMSQSINWLHSFRNSSYHAGLRHEGILHSLANFYFLNCCDLLTKFRPAVWSFGSERVSHRVAKYLDDTGSIELFWKMGDVFDLAWKRLRAVAVNMKPDMVGDLTRDWENTINRVDAQITFIAGNAPHRGIYSRDQVVVDAQTWALIYTEKGVKYAVENGYSGRAAQGPAITRWLLSNYEAPFPVDPIPAWRERLHSFRKEKDAHKALQKYCSFITQTQVLREAISDQSELLDGYIQEQIDLARDK